MKKEKLPELILEEKKKRGLETVLIFKIMLVYVTNFESRKMEVCA